MKSIKKAADRIDDVCKVLCIVFFAGLIFSAFMQVFSRFILKNAFTWTDELSRYFMIWLVFIGAGLGVKRGKHVAIDILYNALPAKARKWAERFNYVLIMAAGSFIGFYGVQLAINAMASRSPSVRVPMGIVYAALPIGTFLMVVFAVINLILTFQEDEEPVKAETGNQE